MPAPILTVNDCEGAGETFTAVHALPDGEPFFGTDVHLSVSGQLHAEALSSALSRVYTFGWRTP